MKRFLLMKGVGGGSSNRITSSLTVEKAVPEEESSTVTTNTGGNNDSSNKSNPMKRFYDSLNDATVVERVRVTLKSAHVFKLPIRKSGAGGWRGADWRDEVWVGLCKIVDRKDQTAIVLFDKSNMIFAICLSSENNIERCVDSSRYFVLRVENQEGTSHRYIGLAFNDRNDSFDFNASLDDARREREADLKLLLTTNHPTSQQHQHTPSKDYSLQEGQKIHVNISKCKLVDDDDFSDDDDDDDDTNADDVAQSVNNEVNKKTLKHVGNSTKMKKTNNNNKSNNKGLLLAPSSKDTSSRYIRPSS